MSLFFFLVGHMHGNLLATSLFFCSLGHNRAKIFYMSPNEKITLFHQSQYKITAIKYYIYSSTNFRSL